MAYILNGHSEWKGCEIKIFSGYMKGQLEEKTKRLMDVIESGRLPISKKNIELIPQEGELISSVIEQKSADADLTILGYTSEQLTENETDTFGQSPKLGNTLFVSAFKEKEIK